MVWLRATPADADDVAADIVGDGKQARRGAQLVVGDGYRSSFDGD